MTELLVGIETGGTKVVAGVAEMIDGEPSLIAPQVTVPTGDDPPQDLREPLPATRRDRQHSERSPRWVSVRSGRSI